MDKRLLSESDICDKFIRPAMDGAGWNGMDQIYREYPLRAGRVVVRGKTAKRDQSTVLRADYALFYKINIPLAVVEAKDNKHAVGAGSHAVTGTTFDPFTRKVGGNQALVMWLQAMTQPRADFDFHELVLPQGRVVVLEIHPARSAPVAFQHVRYIRVDSHKVKLSEHPDKKARLWVRLGLKEDWSGAIVPGATLADLGPAALTAARQRFIDYLLRGEPDARGTLFDKRRGLMADWAEFCNRVA